MSRPRPTTLPHQFPTQGAKCTLCGPKVKAAQRLRSMNCPEVFVCASCQARIGVWVKGGLLVKFQ